MSSKVNKFRKIKSSKVLSAKVVVICEISQAKKLEGTSDGPSSPSSQVKDEVFSLQSPFCQDLWPHKEGACF